MKDKLGVALVKEACPLCGKLEDGPILMNTRLTESMAKKVEDLHGKTIGFMKKPCQECQDDMKLGIKLIVIDESKSEKGNPWRTGNQYIVTEAYVTRIFNETMVAHLLKKRAGFIDQEVEQLLGLNKSLTEEE